MSVLPGRSSARESDEGNLTGQDWIVCFAPDDLKASAAASRIEAELQARGASVTARCVTEIGNPVGLVSFGTLVMVLPTTARQGRIASQLHDFERVLYAYRSGRPYGSSHSGGVRRNPWEVGVVHGVAASAVRLLPRVVKALVHVDVWHDIEDPGPFRAGDADFLSDVEGGPGASQAVVRFAMSLGQEAATVHDITVAQRDRLLRRAWTTVRQCGINSREDCLTLVQEVDYLNETYFEDETRPALHRPLGRDHPVNALGVVLSGRQGDISFSRAETMGSLARAVRKTVTHVRGHLPAFRLPQYHTQKQLRQVYQAASMIASLDADGGRRARRRPPS